MDRLYRFDKLVKAARIAEKHRSKKGNLNKDHEEFPLNWWFVD